MPKQKKKKSARKPQWMVTWWCPHCEIDSGRTELDGPFCYCCERTEGLTEMKRERMSRDVLFGRMQSVADRMMRNLRMAWGISEKDWPKEPEAEMQLLEAMALGQDLQREITKLSGKTPKKRSKVRMRSRSVKRTKKKTVRRGA